MRFPDVPARSLGIGLDLPHGTGGFVREASGRDVLAPPIARFLVEETGRWSHAFVSWQPSRRGRPVLRDYQDAWDALWNEHPWPAVRGLHHTALDAGAVDPRERGPMIELANGLCDRYGLRWVNEDLGLWTLGGRSLPYPLAPVLTDEGLAASVRNVDEVQRRLVVPFVVEFPGFTDGFALMAGNLDPYAFFCRVVEDTGSPCTLDTGHLLGARWLRGHRGEALFDDLERLPLASAFEVHLSGCAIVGDRFVDAHHGVLLDVQLELLRRLLPRCPNLRLVTYEDPRFTAAGSLLPAALPGVAALRAAVEAWA
jgi:uncharacterized protein